jgi:hypothetical protein
MRLAAVVLVSVGFTSLLTTVVAAQSATASFAAPAPLAIDPAPAEATPTPSSTPASSSSSGSSSSSASSRAGPSFPLLTQDQANGLFDGFLLHGFEQATDGVRQGLQRLVDDANLVTNTAADWTYRQSTVVALQHAVQVMSNAMLALLIFWMGLNVLLHPQLGGSYLEVHEAIPRLVLAAGLANSAGHWTALAIDFNNAACAQLLSASSGSLPDLFSHFPVLDHTWLIALLLVAFLLVWAWLYLKMAGRMALLMVLLVLAPAAQLCWVLPQTRGLADRWHGSFWTTLYAQIVVTAALKLAWGFAGANDSNPVTLLITLCLLLLAANSPDLLAGGVARVGLTGLVEAALLAGRLLPAAPAAAAAGLAAGAGAAAGAGGPAVPAAAVPRVLASPLGVSGQSSGTGGGSAAHAKGFGRGGRPATTDSTGDGTAVSNKASGFGRGGTEANG